MHMDPGSLCARPALIVDLRLQEPSRPFEVALTHTPRLCKFSCAGLVLYWLEHAQWQDWEKDMKTACRA